MPTQPQRRSYDASGRRAQAQANRERVLDAARELFVRHGYAGTSIADIAGAAGVSAPTVFAHFGSKVTLLKECVDSALVGDAAPVPLAERPEMVHVRQGRTADEVVSRFAALIAAVGPRVVPISMVMYGAADSDTEIRSLARMVDEQRLTGATQLARIVIDRIGHRTGTNDPNLLSEIRDLIWTMNSPHTFSLLVIERGWPVERYQAWVCRTLTAAVSLPLPR